MIWSHEQLQHMVAQNQHLHLEAVVNQELTFSLSYDF